MSPSAACKLALLNPQSYVSTLITALGAFYGPEFLEWTPESIAMQVREDLGVDLASGQADKIAAGIAVLTTDDFYWNLPKFIHLANVFSSEGVAPDVFDPADAAECAWAITEAYLLSPPDQDEPFSDEIRAYLTEVLKREGFIKPPDVLRLALNADYSQQVSYDFTDDPEMFQAIYEVHDGRTAEIEQMIKENLHEMFTQIASLNVGVGSAEELVQRLRGNLNQQS